MVTLAELKEGGAKNLEQRRYCADHEGEELKLYCRTCQKVICRDCTIITHKQHDYTFIKDVREELTKKIEKLMANVSRKKSKCQGIQDSIPLVREKEKKKLSDEEASIKMFFDKHVLHYIAVLQVHRANVLTDLAKASAVHEKQLLADEESLQISHTLLTSALSFAQQQLSSASSIDLAMMSKQVIKRLETLHKHKLTTINGSLWGVCLSEKDPTSSKIQSLSPDVVANSVVCQINNALIGKNTFQIVNQVSKNLKLEPAMIVTLSSGERCPVMIAPSGNNWTATYYITKYPQPRNGDDDHMNEDSSDDEKSYHCKASKLSAFPTVKVSVRVNGVQAKNSPYKLQLRKEMAAGTRVALHDSKQQGTVVAFQSYHSRSVCRFSGSSLPPNHASVQWDDGDIVCNTTQQVEIDLLKVLIE